MTTSRREPGSDAETAAPPSSSPTRMARLPDHFAAAFEYPGDRHARSPSASTHALKSPVMSSSSQPQTTPRRSPRKSQARLTELSAAFAESDEDERYRPREGVPSPAKRSKAHAVDSDVCEDNVSPRSNGTKKAKVRKRIKRTRDDPNSATGSIYAHLQGVPDLFAERNDIMFCGINPGVTSSHSGHHFAHRSNHFYPSLHLAGITEQRMKPEQDIEFPFLRPLSLGLTNLAGRPTAEGGELLPSELIAGVPILLQKIQRWKPKTVCFVGKGISEAFMKGLKQAGAIHNEANDRKRRASESSSPRKRVLIKTEEQSPSLAADDKPVRSSLKAQVPSSVLCASSADPSRNEDIKPPRTASPSQASVSPKKQLYTKGNAKDDTGYGILPICVSHTRPGCDLLSLDDVTLFFVTPSSSARVTTHFLDDKARILTSLRQLAEHLQAPSAAKSEDAVASLNRQGGSQGNGSPKVEVDPLLDLEPAGLQTVQATTKTVELEIVDVTRFRLMADDGTSGGWHRD